MDGLVVCGDLSSVSYGRPTDGQGWLVDWLMMVGWLARLILLTYIYRYLHILFSGDFVILLDYSYVS